jgi:hypothetical protein
MTQCENNNDPYPDCICTQCAIDNGGEWGKNLTPSWDFRVCGWCSQEKEVTHPISWGYPVFKNKQVGNGQKDS